MMTIEQYILNKIAEEATEVAQRALKASLFGPNEIQPGQADCNVKRLQRELADLEACCEEALRMAVIWQPDAPTWDRWKEEKKDKMRGMLAYAQRLKRVEL